jgi:hypothetical protein
MIEFLVRRLARVAAHLGFWADEIYAWCHEYCFQCDKRREREEDAADMARFRTWYQS